MSKTSISVKTADTIKREPLSALRPMTDEEIEAAAASDPDNPPVGENYTVLPRVRTLRRALGITQEEFAAHYQIPLGTLRDWEQGRSAPDAPARAYLKLIAADAEGVRKTLAKRGKAA
jgi:putative transcriptional regulator